MIKLILLSILWMSSPVADCEDLFQKFIDANSVFDLPTGEEAYLLKLQIRTEFSNPINSRMTIDQSIFALIYEDGFCVKTDEIISIGQENMMYVIMPSARTIVKTAYNPDQLPDIIQLAEYQKQLLTQGIDKSCQMISRMDEKVLKLSTSFSKPLVIQRQLIDKVEYELNPESYQLQSVSMFFLKDQSIKKQTIKYVNFDKYNTKKNALDKSFLFKPNGQLRDEFLHYEFIEK